MDHLYLKRSARREAAAICGALLIFLLLSNLFYLVGVRLFQAPLSEAEDAIIDCFSSMFPLLCSALILSRNVEAYRLKKPRSPEFLRSIVFFFALLLPLNLFSALLSDLLESVGIESYVITTVPPGNLGSLILFLIQYTLIPAVFEELLFRGVILTRLSVFGQGRAILLSSLLFALLHASLASLPGIFLLAVLFAAVDLACGSLLPSVLLHFLNNLIAVMSDILPDGPALDLCWAGIVLLSLFSTTLVLFWALTGKLHKPKTSPQTETLPASNFLLSAPTLFFFTVCGLQIWLTNGGIS